MCSSLQTIVFVSPVAYSALNQRHQEFARGLHEKGYQIKYVNPIRSPGFSISRKIVSQGFEVIDIFVPFRTSRFPSIQKIATRIAFFLLKTKVKISPELSLLWIADPLLSDFTSNNWSFVIYDKCDVHGKFPGQSFNAIRRFESLIFSKADLILVSHPLIEETVFNNSCPIKLIPNAVSSSWKQVPKRNIDGKSTITIVSAGAHFEWVDCAWLIKLCKLKKVELHIAGPGRGSDFKKLINLPEVKYHGILEHSKLKDLFLKCDIGLIPFKDIDLVSGVDPIKAYEYAASGLHVWCTGKKDLMQNPFIDLFIEKNSDIKSLINEPAQICYNKHNDSRIPTWNDRLEAILDSLSRIKTR